MDTREELMDNATEYTIGKYKIRWRGKLWSIYEDARFIYDKTQKDFTFEPQPSNRTDQFRKNTRFTLIEAKKIVDELNKNVRKIKK